MGPDDRLRAAAGTATEVGTIGMATATGAGTVGADDHRHDAGDLIPGRHLGGGEDGHDHVRDHARTRARDDELPANFEGILAARRMGKTNSSTGDKCDCIQ